MNEQEAAGVLGRLLTDLGVAIGDTVFVATDMARVPLPRWTVPLNRDALRQREDRWCAFLYDQIARAVGPEGTVLASTFSYACGNPAKPFVVEETPSEIGPFTEWLRQRPGAVRSLHPIFSVAGIGPNAAAILGGEGRAAFGASSPFGRLTGFNVKFLSLGVPFSRSVTYLHHLEQCYGCNHRYHKALSTPVYRNGQQVPGPFLAYLRWRGTDAGPDFGPCERRLIAEGAMRSVPWNGRDNHCVAASDVDRIGYAMLEADPCAFADRPIRVDLDESAVAAQPVTGAIAMFKLTT